MDAPVTFAAYVERWHEYYVLAGTAAVTLMGLLFVALSLHLDEIVRDEGAHFSSMAMGAFISFVYVLLISLILLMPIGGGRPVGMTIIVIGLMRLVLTLRGSGAIRRDPGPSVRRSYLIFRYLLPLAAVALLIASGCGLLLRQFEMGMAGLSTAVILLLVTATRTAWDLIVLIGRHKLDRAGSAKG
jgi:hypothetical protein